MPEFRDKVEIEDVFCERETAKAILVDLGSKGKKWIPKSLIDDDSEVYATGHTGTLVVPEWFAVKENLV